jgi:hypothetical protein
MRWRTIVILFQYKHKQNGILFVNIMTGIVCFFIFYFLAGARMVCTQASLVNQDDSPVQVWTEALIYTCLSKYVDTNNVAVQYCIQK